MYRHLEYDEVAAHVVRVRLNRPAAANALSGALLAELDDAVARIAEDDEVRVWLLTGSPRPDGRPCFSAGADLKEALDPKAGVYPRAAALVTAIEDLPKPSIALIDGVCTTGGLELALACHLRIAADSAQLSDWHLRRTGLGIGQWGMAARLARLVGTDRARELILLGTELDGERAERIGLVNRLVPAGELDAAGLEWATTIAGLPRRGVRTTMEYLALQDGRSRSEALALAERAPSLTGLALRPFRDAAARFQREKE